MSIKEKLLEEYEAAINAVFGDLAEEEFSEEKVEASDLDSISKKVAFYLDL